MNAPGRPGAGHSGGGVESWWGERCITSTSDGPKWTARSNGEGLEWEMGGRRV